MRTVYSSSVESRTPSPSLLHPSIWSLSEVLEEEDREDGGEDRREGGDEEGDERGDDDDNDVETVCKLCSIAD